MSVLTELCGLFCKSCQVSCQLSQIGINTVDWASVGERSEQEHLDDTAVRYGRPPLDVWARQWTELRRYESCTVQMLLYVLGESFSLDSVAARTDRPSFDL